MPASTPIEPIVAMPAAGPVDVVAMTALTLGGRLGPKDSRFARSGFACSFPNPQKANPKLPKASRGGSCQAWGLP